MRKILGNLRIKVKMKETPKHCPLDVFIVG